MKRLDLREVATHVHVILTCMPKLEKSAGGWRSEQAVRSATSQIMALFERTLILTPDPVLIGRGEGNTPISYGPGEFGVSEPWPVEPESWAPAVLKPPSESDVG